MFVMNPVVENDMKDDSISTIHKKESNYQINHFTEMTSSFRAMSFFTTG